MLALDPRETFEVGVDTDAKARFRFRYCTAAEFLATDRLAMDRAYTVAMPASEIAGQLFKTLREHLVGWTGVMDAAGADIPFDLATLERIVTMQEAWLLFWQARIQWRLTEEDRKNSDSPSPTAGEGSATADARSA